MLAASADPARPTRRRYIVILIALLINLVSYCDRACISVAAPAMAREFGYTPAEVGLIFGVFSLAYALFLAPWGAVADRQPARVLVPLVTLGWSLFTALTALTRSLASLLAVRFLFGATEAALSPTVAVVIARWIPRSERATAFGSFLAGGRLGGAIAPPVAAFLILRYGWRGAFLGFCALGLVFPLIWWRTYREAPALHPSVNRLEREHIERGCDAKSAAAGAPAVFWSEKLLLLMAVAFGYTLMWQFYITWFPTYLIQRRGLPLAQAAWYAGVPFLSGLAGTWLGGLATDLLSRRHGVIAARARLGLFSLTSSAALLLVGMYWPGRELGALLVGLAAGAGDAFLGAAWAASVDIGGENAGAASGLMNAASNLGGFVSPVLMGLVLELWNDWDRVLLTAAAANLISAVLWLRLHRAPRSAIPASATT